jgi:hypothetical protein
LGTLCSALRRYFLGLSSDLLWHRNFKILNKHKDGTVHQFSFATNFSQLSNWPIVRPAITKAQVQKNGSYHKKENNISSRDLPKNIIVALTIKLE